MSSRNADPSWAHAQALLSGQEALPIPRQPVATVVTATFTVIQGSLN